MGKGKWGRCYCFEQTWSCLGLFMVGFTAGKGQGTLVLLSCLQLSFTNSAVKNEHLSLRCEQRHNGIWDSG